MTSIAKWLLTGSLSGVKLGDIVLNSYTNESNNVLGAPGRKSNRSGT